MDFSQCSKKIYPYCKGIQNQSIFVAKLFWAGGSKNFSDSPYDSHEYEKKLISGTKPKPLTDKLKQTFPSPVDVAGIEAFFMECIDEDRIPEAMNAYGIPDTIEPDKNCLSAALARQYQLLFESPDIDVEDIISTEYRRLLADEPEDDLIQFKPLYKGDSASAYGGEQEYQKNTDNSFRHVWELRNTGTVTWEGRKLVFIKTYKTGPLAEQTVIQIPKMEPGTHKKIAVVMQTRGKEGRFCCHFEMQDSDGKNCFPNHNSMFDIKVKIDFIPDVNAEV